jgi:acyl-[acyl-carrier-protein]-phospholipid O-acyltransferase/long-chain-fatty-acid--[acyl-carrier-protein] ligase
VPVFYHRDPLDIRGIARLARESGATVLFTTPALLKRYVRKTRKEDFANLRRVIAGGGKLPPALADLFEDKFGLRPLEAYGSAEASPAAALSVPHFAGEANFQSGWKEGSAGLPLPGLAMKVVDPVTGGHLPPGEEGHLLIKGPAVMKGYLGRPELTALAMRGGWYHTGDAASVDEQGFVSVTGRLKAAGNNCAAAD